MKLNPFLSIILFLGLFLRLYGIDWDAGFHLHPDERWLVMVAERISWQDLNPHFFAYGALPLYLLKAVAHFFALFNPQLSTYQGIVYVGRFLSTLFDTGTIFLVYLITKSLVSEPENKNSKLIHYLAAALYATTVFSIQASHFFAVDTFLTFFTSLVLYGCIKIKEKKWLILCALAFSAALASKITALILAPVILTSLIINYGFKPVVYIKFLIFNIAFLFLFHPYLFLDGPIFLKETLNQLQMSKSAYTFPYTLQYVNTPAYLYFLKDLFFYGIGPSLTVLGFVGAAWSLKIKNFKLKTLVLFFWLYFFITGRSAVKFMRYLLPLYPLLAVFAALLFVKIKDKFSFRTTTIFSSFVILFNLLFALNFLTIYTQTPSRVAASKWMTKNILPGSVLAEEHWDDKLPLSGGERFRIEELALYEFDTPQKWEKINQQLRNSDYVVLTSNRLYVPLQKMMDCKNLAPGRCYTQTANYYQRLFRGTLGFKKVAEFSVNPLFDWGFSALSPLAPDESFTVYDHPKVIIFKKML